MSHLHINDRPGAYPASWYAATTPPLAPFARAAGRLSADICIIGGGYTGLSAALHLAEAGVDVALLEAHRVGFGASGRNGGQVGSGQRLGQAALERMVGRTDAHALWQMGEEAKALVQALIARHTIACDYRPGVVHASWSHADAAEAHAEAAHLARDYGYTRIEPLDQAGIAALVGAPVYKGGAVDWGAGHLNPLAYALGLARAADAAGARIYERAEVANISPGGAGGFRLGLKDGAELRARQVIVAANGYLGRLVPKVAARVMPINNFIVATEPLDARAAGVIARDVAVADSKFVINYFRLSPDGRLLFGGGESYGARFPVDIAATVRKPLEQVFPQLRGVGFTHAWGGTLAITRARLPLFCAPMPGMLSASGYSGHGVALATLAGRVLAEAAQGPSAAFDLMARLPVRPFPGGATLRAPLLAMAMTWFALRDRLGI